MSKNYVKEAFVIALGILAVITMISPVDALPDLFFPIGWIDDTTAVLILDAVITRYFKFSPTGLLNKFVNKGR